MKWLKNPSWGNEFFNQIKKKKTYLLSFYSLVAHHPLAITLIYFSKINFLFQLFSSPRRLSPSPTTVNFHSFLKKLISFFLLSFSSCHYSYHHQKWVDILKIKSVEFFLSCTLQTSDTSSFFFSNPHKIFYFAFKYIYFLLILNLSILSCDNRGCSHFFRIWWIR